MEKYQNHSKAMESVEWLLRYFDIAEINKDTLLKARDLDMTDYEDAVIAWSAQKAHCDYIITHNIVDFKNAPVPALSPLEFMAK